MSDRLSRITANKAISLLSFLKSYSNNFNSEKVNLNHLFRIIADNINGCYSLNPANNNQKGNAFNQLACDLLCQMILHCDFDLSTCEGHAIVVILNTAQS